MSDDCPDCRAAEAHARESRCPDCGVAVGQQHDPSCDVARCPACGGQRLSCGCRTRRKALPWDGTWPGVKEAMAFGWYARMVPGKMGWQRCNKDDEGASADLNRLAVECRWNPRKQTWEKR